MMMFRADGHEHWNAELLLFVTSRAYKILVFLIVHILQPLCVKTMVICQCV